MQEFSRFLSLKNKKIDLLIWFLDRHDSYIPGSFQFLIIYDKPHFDLNDLDIAPKRIYESDQRRKGRNAEALQEQRKIKLSPTT